MCVYKRKIFDKPMYNIHTRSELLNSQVNALFVGFSIFFGTFSNQLSRFFLVQTYNKQQSMESFELGFPQFCCNNNSQKSTILMGNRFAINNADQNMCCNEQN